jgi:hypothetical protein
MKARQLEKLGIPRHLTKVAKWMASHMRQTTDIKPTEVKDKLIAIVENPSDFLEDEFFGDFATAMMRHQKLMANREKAFNHAKYLRLGNSGVRTLKKKRSSSSPEHANSQSQRQLRSCLMRILVMAYPSAVCWQPKMQSFLTQSASISPAE